MTSHARVASDTTDERAEDRADTSSRTDEAGGGSACSDELACSVDGGTDGDGLGCDAASLATGDVGGGVAEHGAAHEETGLVVEGLESRAGAGGT